MKYYFFIITKQDIDAGNRTGFAYALKNKSKWIDATDILSVEINTYDKALTHIVYNNKVYYIHQDYVNVTDKYRVYVVKESTLSSEIVDV